MSGGHEGRGGAEAQVRALRATGQRVTPARRAVLEVLADADAGAEHLRAEDVVARAADARPGVHRATVYRALEALTEAGLVVHTHTARGATVHHLAADGGHEHAHVQCHACGRLEDVPAGALTALAEHLTAERGFTLDVGHVALVGTCSACREALPGRRAAQP